MTVTINGIEIDVDDFRVSEEGASWSLTLTANANEGLAGLVAAGYAGGGQAADVVLIPEEGTRKLVGSGIFRGIGAHKEDEGDRVSFTITGSGDLSIQDV